MTSARLTTPPIARDRHPLLRTDSRRSGGASAILPGLTSASAQHPCSTSRKRRPQSWNGALNLDGWSRIVPSALHLLSLTIHRSLPLLALCLIPARLLAWTNGELSIWFDPDRGQALEPLIQKFENDSGIKVKLESPENRTEDFAMAVQVAKGPDIVIWAHDKLGEWADAGIIAPIEVSPELRNKFLPKAWEAVAHRGSTWGYPIALETVSLIYNKKLLEGPPPAQLSEVVDLNAEIKKKHPGTTAILWDYNSSYYSWGILASAGGYVFGKKEKDYDPQDVGVATSGAIDGLSEIISLIRAGVLPKSVTYSTVEEQMARGKIAMMISGPWAWANLVKSGIDFGLAPVPGVDGHPGRPFVGVSVAYLNRSSPNQDLAKEFLEHCVLTEEGLTAMDHGKPLGIPALTSLEEKMVKNDPLLQELKVCVDGGEVMPNIPQTSRFFTSLGAALQIATNGQATPEAALKEAAVNMRHL
jgi:maltose/maltodextrin transport system substrate-binding protein